MKVDFTKIGPGKCSWCKKEKDEVLTLAFADGSFVGSYCFGDFKKALSNKLEVAKAAGPQLPFPEAKQPNGPPAAVPVK